MSPLPTHSSIHTKHVLGLIQSWIKAGSQLGMVRVVGGERPVMREAHSLPAVPGMQEDPGILALPQDGSGCGNWVLLGAQVTAIPIYQSIRI